MNRPDETTRPAETDADIDVYRQRISVPFEFPVHFTRGVFAPDAPLLESVICRLGEKRRHRAAVYVDSGVTDADPELLRRIREYFHARPRALELAGAPQIIPGGEPAKNSWESVRDIMFEVGNLHLDRQSYVIAIGGGSVLDMVGFAASIVHRGLRLLRLPTTTLAQNDAGVGVKNGMDEHGQKNFVGTFAPPFAVVNDFDFLRTLRFEDWIAGVAEAFKVAIIADADFLRSLCDRAGDLRARDESAMEQVVRRCAILHMEHTRTGGDSFEFGSARPLDFGHWSAHKLELLTGCELGHGHAVAVGVALDSVYACREGLIGEPELEMILTGLTDAGLPIWHDHLGRRGEDGQLLILDGLAQFREHLGGALTVTLPDGLGRKIEVHQMNVELIDECVRTLRRRSRG